MKPNSTPENPNRIWVPGDLVVDYYAQRATDGGLMISEGIPPSLEVWFDGFSVVLRFPFSVFRPIFII